MYMWIKRHSGSCKQHGEETQLSIRREGHLVGKCAASHEQRHASFVFHFFPVLSHGLATIR